MLKRTIDYTDYLGTPRREDFYFNLSKAELAKLAMLEEDPTQSLTSIGKSGNPKLIIETFEKIIALAYGVRSEDGRQFIKSPELSKEFMQTEAYSILFLELVTDSNAAAAFMNGVVPADVVALRQAPQDHRPPTPTTVERTVAAPEYPGPERPTQNVELPAAPPLTSWPDSQA